MNIDLFELIKSQPYYNGKKLHISKNSQGYPRVRIKNKVYRLHRLVALKYLTNPKSKPLVDHINGDKNDFSVLNLQWLTYSENSKKAFMNRKSMANFHKSKPRRSIISICNTTGKKVEHHSLRACAKYLNRDVAAVYRCLNGEWNNCNNHTLKYIY